jgi:hypothetical protein
MSKFNEVFEFEGQKYVKSERASSEVKDGDVVRIREDIPSSIHWASTERRSLGTVQKVTALHENMGATFDCISGLWSSTYLEILEPATKTKPRPHADLIKQWADDDSLLVQFKGHNSGKWLDSPLPSWSKDYEYRIKPKTVPAWQVLYKQNGDFYISNGHYQSKEEFTRIGVNKGKEFIRFVPETEKQFEI